MDGDILNTYRFTSYKALRGLLGSWPNLVEEAQAGNYASVSIMLDLQKAIVVAMTDRQRQAVELHLFHGLRANECAERMGIHWRVVYILVRDGVTSLLAYLQDGSRPRWWQQWELDYVRAHPYAPRKEIALHLGRSVDAVYKLVWVLRQNGEIIGPATRGGRAFANQRSQRAADGVSDLKRSTTSTASQS